MLRKRPAVGGLPIDLSGTNSGRRSWLDHTRPGDARLPRAVLAGARLEMKHIAAFAVAIGLYSAHQASAITPSWDPGGSSLFVTHDVGNPEPSGSPFSASITIGSGTAALTAPFNS